MIELSSPTTSAATSWIPPEGLHPNVAYTPLVLCAA
jgi:hypothetical protein